MSNPPVVLAAGWLERGIHVITPNKKAGSGPIADYEVLQSLGKHGSSHFFYETTVGANWTPHANLTIRPEVRHEWVPAADNTETIIGADAIFTF